MGAENGNNAVIETPLKKGGLGVDEVDDRLPVVLFAGLVAVLKMVELFRNEVMIMNIIGLVTQILRHR